MKLHFEPNLDYQLQAIEAVCDLFRGQGTHLAQRERKLCVAGQGRMTARENEAQPVVAHAVGVRELDLGGRGAELLGNVCERGIEAGAPPDFVNRLEAPRGHKPGARVGGNAALRPLLEGGDERIVQRLLGEIEITEETDEGGEHAAGIGTVDGVNRAPSVRSRVLAHGQCPAYA